MTTLAHQIVRAPGAAPARAVFVLHGILGSGRNWRTFARKLVTRRPDWAAVLVDLRHHGESPALPAPNTLATCADDLDALAAWIGQPDAVIGHSFGGRVALTYAGRHGDDLDAVGVLDSLPATPPETDPTTGDVPRVLDALRASRVPAAERSTVRAELTARGLSETLVRWLLTSLRRDPDGWRWVWDLDAVEEMLADYHRADLWPVVEAAGRGPTFVRAGRSDRWASGIVARLEAARAPVVTLPRAGHWLHVDDPQGTLDAVSALLG